MDRVIPYAQDSAYNLLHLRITTYLSVTLGQPIELMSHVLWRHLRKK